MKLNKEQKELILSKRVGSNVFEKERQRFLMLPAGLAYGELYETLSTDSKFAWTILNDRAKLSKRNGWFDEDGSIYFIFNNIDLVRILKMSEPKVIKIKKELVEYGLLEQKRLGRGLPNRLYLFEPVLTESDIHLMLKENSDNTENLDITQNLNILSSRTKNSLVLDNTDITQNLNILSSRTKNSLVLDNTDTDKNLNILSSRTKNSSVLELNNFKANNNKYINNNINNINESAKAESNIELSTNQYFKKSKLLTDFRIMGIPESVTDELYRAIGDTEKISYICGVIFQAKRYVSNQTNHEIYLEELSEDNFKELTKCILRALKKDLTENTVEKFDRYLFKTIQKFFENYVLEKKAQVPLVDWNL